MNLKALLLLASAGLALGMLPACSDSSGSSSKDIVPDSGFGTDGLDTLGGAKAPEPVETEDEPVVIDQGTGDGAEAVDEDRDWERERESQSLLGRSRDKAKTLRNSIQGGTDEPENGLAVTRDEDAWVGTGGWAWDLPDAWQMAIPGSGRFGEMYIKSDFGAATVTFTKDSATVAQLERQIGSMVVDLIGSKVTPKVKEFEAEGMAVKLLSLEGTFVDPSAKGGSNEKPFYAVRGAIIDMGSSRVMIVMLGPENTVMNNSGVFEAMVKGMYQR